MKTAVLWILRMIVAAAPAYSLYVFMQGAGQQYGQQWWLENSGYIGWALGAYLIIFLGSMSWTINWPQIVALFIGAVGLMYFYFSRDIYSAFYSIPFFAENKKLLPLIPYIYVVIILTICSAMRKRYMVK